MGKDASADAVELMALCHQHPCPDPERLHRPGILHTPLLLIWVYLINHLRVIDMHLIRIDADYGA